MINPSEDRGHLLTEQTNPRSCDLDLLNTQSLVDLFISEDVKPQQAVAGAANAIGESVEAIASRLMNGGRLFTSVRPPQGDSEYSMLRNVLRHSAVLQIWFRESSREGRPHCYVVRKVWKTNVKQARMR